VHDYSTGPVLAASQQMVWLQFVIVHASPICFPMPTQERRRRQRFRLELSCRVSFPDKPHLKLHGYTCEVSRSGVSIRCPGEAWLDPPKVGDVAHILITLPTAVSITPRYLACTAVVIRMEDGDDGPLMAFDIKRMQFAEQQAVEVRARASAELFVAGFVQ